MTLTLALTNTIYLANMTKHIKYLTGASQRIECILWVTSQSSG